MVQNGLALLALADIVPCIKRKQNGVAGMTGTKHSPSEIAAKLRQADELAAQGKGRSEILRALRISPMTYHRWRKTRLEASSTSDPRVEAGDTSAGGSSKVDASGFAALSSREQISAFQELQRENLRLRELFTDALLEKIKLEEELRALRSAHRVRGGAVA
jgi:hypothetical protein